MKMTKKRSGLGEKEEEKNESKKIQLIQKKDQ